MVVTWEWVNERLCPPQNLEMIKVREEEAGTVAKVMRKFTYKGEVEIDIADDSKIEVKGLCCSECIYSDLPSPLTLPHLPAPPPTSPWRPSQRVDLSQHQHHLPPPLPNQYLVPKF